jgi:hypothetical protein
MRQKDAKESHTGYVVDCNKSDELAGVLSLLLTDDAKRKTMGKVARDWAVDQFDWTRHVQQIERAFEKHLGRDERFEEERFKAEKTNRMFVDSSEDIVGRKKAA